MSVTDRIGERLMGLRLITLERRLIKGWDYLEMDPEKDRPGQPSFELWMTLLRQYEDGCREFLKKTGRWWTPDERPAVEDAEQGEDP